jgi:hypothetical protein
VADPGDRGPKSVIELQRFDANSDSTAGRVSVEAHIVEQYLQLVYRWRSWAEPLILSTRAASPQRRDELWRNTCAEMFVAFDSEVHSNSSYLEFNFSPSGDWAAYHFDATRKGMRPHTWSGAAVPLVSSSGSPEDFALQALVPLEAMGRGFYRVAYASVVETEHGLSYWALKHPSDRPDFHHPESFAASLEFPS